MSSECGCHLWNGKGCCLQFTSKHVEEVRSHCAALSHNKLDMVILEQIKSSSNFSETCVSDSGHSLIT